MAYYIGVDIGTGSTKAVAINSAADRILYTTQSHYPTLQPLPTYNEQDPEQIWIAFVHCVRQTVEFMKESPAGIGISSAMHSLIPVDDQGKPLMNSITWADSRSTFIAEKIQTSLAAKKIYKNTGTPIHAMSPLAKICWVRKHEQGIFRRTNKFISIKEYIWFKLFGEYQVDHSIASATGLFDIHKRTWYTPSLQQAAIDFHRLSQPVPTGYSRTDVNPEIRQQLLTAPETPFVIGASDGCLANLGSNAVLPGMASLTIGTSGAIRMASDSPCYNFHSMTFNYLLDEKTFICGGPINNGGAVWRWFVKNFIDNTTDPKDFATILKKTESIRPGSEGLIFLPYLMGERAPIWDSKACGTFFGMNTGHTQAHFIRAVIEGISFAVYSVGNALEEASGKIQSIYASGGFIQSKEWLQIVADIFNKIVYRQNTEDASSIGAALLAIKSVEKRESYPAFKSDELQEIIYPDKERHKVYQEFYPFFRRLYIKLKGEMAELFHLTTRR